MGGKAFEEIIEILNQAAFSVVYVNRCGDVHGVHRQRPSRNAAFFQRDVPRYRNINVVTPIFRVECEMFGQ